jgi:hypothetical protein
MFARDNKTFKAESKTAPFMFKVRTVGSVIKCEGMKYNFTTTAKVKNESKKVQVHGSYLGESRVERKPMARRTSARRVSESNRIARRPSATRRMESRRTMRRPVRRTTSLEARRIAARRRANARAVEGRRVARRPATMRTRSESLARSRAMRARRATRR